MCRAFCSIVLSLLLVSPAVFADLVFVNAGNTLDGYTGPLDNNADDIADSGLTSLFHSESFIVSGVSFNLNFELASSGGFLAGNISSLGVWSDTNPETGGGQQFSFNGSTESITLDNISITDVVGGSATFNSINRVGIVFATGASDSGVFTVNGSNVLWDDLDDGDPFDLINTNIDGDNGSEAYDLRSAVGSDFSSFTLAGDGSAWRLDTFEFDVTVNPVPELSSVVLLTIPAIGVALRRRRKTTACTDTPSVL